MLNSIFKHLFVEIFLPCPDGLLVNLHESRELVVDLLNQLPNLHQNNLDSGCAYGPALQAAHKLLVRCLIWH